MSDGPQFERDVTAALSRLELQMPQLVGNGQLGRIGNIENKVRYLYF